MKTNAAVAGGASKAFAMAQYGRTAGAFLRAEALK